MLVSRRHYSHKLRGGPHRALERTLTDLSSVYSEPHVQSHGRWKSAIDLGLIRHENRGDTIVVDFSEWLSRAEREEYVMFLSGIKHEPLRGDKLVVEDPEAFYSFVEEETPRPK